LRGVISDEETKISAILARAGGGAARRAGRRLRP
jgi:hypothetical protein